MIKKLLKNQQLFRFLAFCGLLFVMAPVLSQPSIYMYPLTHDFGNVNVGAATVTSPSFSITNNGTSDLTIGSFTLNGPNAGDFSIQFSGNLVIAAGNSESFTVSFTPSFFGSKVASIDITSDDPITPVLNFLLAGNVIGVGQLNVSETSQLTNGSTLNFGNQAINIQSQEKIITIGNTGTDLLTVSSISGPSNPEFYFTSSPTFPIVLSPSQFVSLLLVFKPTSVTNFADNFTVFSDAPVNSNVTVNLTGDGVINQLPSINKKDFTVSIFTPQGANVGSIDPQDSDGSISSVQFNPSSPDFNIDNYGNISVRNTSNFINGNTVTANVEVYDNYNAMSSTTLTFTFNNTLVNPNLTFINIPSNVNYKDAPFQLDVNTNPASTGQITFEVYQGTSIASIDSRTGLVTVLGAGDATFVVNQAGDANFSPGTDTLKMTFGKARASIIGYIIGNELAADSFALAYREFDYDGPVSISIFSGNAVSIVSNDYLKPLSIDTSVIYVYGPGTTNYFPVEAYVTVIIYSQKKAPLAVDDLIRIKAGDIGIKDIDSNDVGYTGLLTKNIDLDIFTPGIQSTFNSTSLGDFSVDTNGVLTFIPFEGFRGRDYLPYTIYDSDSLESNIAYINIEVIQVGAAPALKANEVMTPNGDGLNDELVIGYADYDKNSEFWVLDENGNEVYYTSNYRNNWSGTDKQKTKITSGIYYYIYKEYNPSTGALERTYENYCQIIR